MSDTDVVDFSGEPKGVSERRLGDLPERVVAGDPHHVTRMHFESPDGSLIAGTWTSTPGKWHAFADRDEFCYILSGHARLIDEAGCKGLRVGGVYVSTQHANFMENDGGGTEGDVRRLIDGVRERVAKVHGVDLEVEVRRWI